jgi:hypothetical protein
VALNQW